MLEQKYPFKPDYKWVKTKGLTSHEYDLIDPAQRRLYFSDVAGEEIEKLREYVANNSFIGYLLAPKMAGKGTYAKMFIDLIGEEYVSHISVGDVVRAAENEFREKGENSEIYQFIKSDYRGFMSIDEAFDGLVNRSTSSLMSTEFILEIVKYAIEKVGRKTILLDGFPRQVDQIAYSLYFRDLVNYRNDPDCFIMINVPIEMIDVRFTDRVICPVCQTSRGLHLNPTTKIGYDESTDEYYLMCDNAECNSGSTGSPQGARMVQKEGDEHGIKNIESRLDTDFQLIEMAKNMHGIPKIEVYGAVGTDVALDICHDFEFTKQVDYASTGSADSDAIVKKESLFTLNDNGNTFHGFLPPNPVVQIIRQLVDTFVGK